MPAGFIASPAILDQVHGNTYPGSPPTRAGEDNCRRAQPDLGRVRVTSDAKSGSLAKSANPGVRLADLRGAFIPAPIIRICPRCGSCG